MKKLFIVTIIVFILSTFAVAEIDWDNDVNLFLYANTSSSYNYGAKGLINNATLFDGTGDYIDTNTKPCDGESEITISMWVNVTGGDLKRHGLGNGAGTPDSIVFHYATETDGTGTNWGLDGTYCNDATNNPSENQWHHMVMTYDGSNMVTYQDGSQLTSCSKTGTLTLDNNLRIGNTYNQFIGSMKNLEIVCSAISSTDVGDLYGGTKSMTDYGTIEYYNDLSSFSDKSGNTNNLEAVSGIIANNGYYDLDGDDDHISLPYSVSDVGGEYTITAWINPDVDQQNTIFEYRQTDSKYVFLAVLSDGDLYVNCNGNSVPTGNPLRADINSLTASSGWSHTAYSVSESGDFSKLYVDGSLVATLNDDCALDSRFTGTKNYMAFGRRDTVEDFEGQLQGLAIFNKALTETEISDLYDQERNYNPYYAESSSTINETEAKSTILEAVNSLLVSPVVYYNQKVYTYDGSNHDIATFDMFVTSGSQRWGFNYVDINQTFSNMSNLDQTFLVWENESLSSSELTAQITNFINSTMN